ncbi:hypothetical protein RO3G_08358 [Rhizopus delemar RA 99-880]|uniref:W2 domain-containing protein n=3 Tax=Rhizopus TaxID=4842 RepID=I1C5C3_RHIO9|nr:hypothetical protein RO3G_08358 [Rhizopus delemar RA 99-880]|eukprot:EIE83653.1 hypothetical protein RO3G_08358 [Rhizopus delemar RA 99-880]
MNITKTNICSSPVELKPKQRKERSFHSLIREIKRLRDENINLRSSVALLKNDIQDATLSRKDTDATHKRFYDEYMDKNAQLEMDLMDKEDEIKRLKQQIEDLQSQVNSGLTLHDAAYYKRKHSNVFGCYEFEEDVSDCQPTARDTALPEVDIKMDEMSEQKISGYQQDNEEESEEEEEEEEEEPPFEQVATSYIHQAILSKLSSARVRLELDDLIVKYEPTSETVSAVLADSFMQWISSSFDLMNTQSATKVFATKIQTGITNFWEAVLQYYTTEEEYQLQLLKQIEILLLDSDKIKSSGIIVNHFDRLILMLYKYHVVDDDAVLNWWNCSLSNNTISKKMRTVTTRFVEWVQEEDEEEEEEEEEEEVEDDKEDSSSDTEPDEEVVDSLLKDHSRYCCICHLDASSQTKSLKNLDECSCDSKYTTPSVIQKPKKSVTISLVVIT